MEEHQKVQAESVSQVQNRRRFIKGGVAATGAAYVVPQILSTATASAQTTTCYGLKFENGGCIGAAGNDPACGPNFNAAFALAYNSGGSQVAGCGAPAVASITAGGTGDDNKTATVTAGTNCTIEFAGSKSSNTCFWPGNSEWTGNGNSGNQPTGTVVVSADKKTATFTATKDLSHLTLVICCTGSSTT